MLFEPTRPKILENLNMDKKNKNREYDNII